MKREVQSVVLVLIGGAVLRISIGDTYLRYVKESMRPWLIISGAILVLMGLLALVDVIRRGRAHHDNSAELCAGESHDDEIDMAHPMAPPGLAADLRAEVLTSAAPADRGAHGDQDAHHGEHAHAGAPHPHDDDDDGHGHGGPPKAAWLLVLPVLAIFLIAPPALGAFTAERGTQSVTKPAGEALAPPLPAGDPVVINVGDYAARAVWDDGRTLFGRNVTMVGFVTPQPGGTGWWLTRLTLTCCAADAVTTKIQPEGDIPKDLAANTWVQLTGTWVPGGGVQTESAVPRIKVASWKEVVEPKNPYE